MLAQILLYLFPGADQIRDWVIVDGAIIDWRRPEPQPASEQIEAARLPATKALRIEADRQECRRRLIAHYGDALEQVSRAAGLYGATAQANHAAGVEATIDASNVARDLINAATTVEAVEAVVVTWPELT